mgnify:CR=1 FL=1
MKRVVTIGLLSLVVVGCSQPVLSSFKSGQTPEAIAANPSQAVAAEPLRDVFYMSDHFGFRMVLPSGYVVHSPTDDGQRKPAKALEVIELWQQSDFLNRENLPETPPILRIQVYNNSQRSPLSQWKGELSKNDDRTVQVAGQPAIAYSSTGLYETDNVVFSSPDGRYIFRMSAGYIDAKAPIRKTFQELVNSFTFDLLPTSKSAPKWQVNYSRLQNLLAKRDWQAADFETRAIIRRLAIISERKGDFFYGSKSMFQVIPAQDLQTIDALWSKASNGRFGYRAQQRIWQQVSAQTKNPKLRVEKFAQAVGWRHSKPTANPLSMELSANEWLLDDELTYTATAPAGHFPWAGISSSHLVDMLKERSQGCGSCTIDAMYLAKDRYYDYLPGLFSRLSAKAGR